MKLYTYIVIKIILIVVAIYLFLHPGVFSVSGYQLSVDGVVVCRGISFMCAINIASTLVDNIYKNKIYYQAKNKKIKSDN